MSDLRRLAIAGTIRRAEAVRYPTLEHRVASRVDCSGGPHTCWIWSGPRGQWGSVSIQVGPKDACRNVSLQRLVYGWAFGDLREDVKISTSCGEKACLNPFHFVLYPPVTRAARFWSYVKDGPGCWEWQGHRQWRGYGEFTLTRTTGTPAHRFSYELHFGPVPKDMVVCHRCDNPPCVRPDHLFLGTQLDNIHDCIAKGRNSRGARHGRLVVAGRHRRMRSEPEPCATSSRGKEP